MRRTFLAAALLALLPMVARASCAEGCQDAESIEKTLDAGIALNHKLEVSAKGDPPEYQAARRNVESFLEAVAPTCVDRAVQLLSRNDDAVLAAKLLEYALEMQNSADESISTALGLIFVANPAALERAARQLKPDQRTALSGLMKLGLENAISESETDDATAGNRRSRLQTLGDF